MTLALFVQGYVFSNFNSFNRGNRFLENALQESHSLRYFKYNLYNYTTMFGNINYSKTTNPVVNRAFFTGINQISEKVNANFENESLNGIVGYQRSFMKYYKASVNVNLNWSKFNSLRANLVIQPILRLILYKLQSPSQRLQRITWYTV
jgi:hypothetical protein